MPTAFAHARALNDGIEGLVGAFDDARGAFDNGQIAPETFQSVTELATLQLHSRLETFFEDLFISCLMGESGIEVDRLVAPEDRTTAYSIIGLDLRREGQYVTWLPVSLAYERAAHVFRLGRPFSRLVYRPGISQGVNELIVLRNAVAHPSQRAFQKFVELAGQRNYHVERAADFLLAQREARSEFEHLASLIRAVARALAEPTEADVEAILGPERLFSSAERRVPPGKYRCSSCGAVVHLKSVGELPLCQCDIPGGGPCPTCGQATPCPVCSRPRLRQSTYARDILP